MKIRKYLLLVALISFGLGYFLGINVPNNKNIKNETSKLEIGITKNTDNIKSKDSGKLDDVLKEQQARARDIGRISTLSFLSAVFETYYSDNGMFPKLDSNGCLSDSEGKVSNKNLSSFLKSGKASIDPSEGHLNGLCEISNSYGYHTLASDGISQTSYILIANVETPKKANLVLTEELKKELLKTKPSLEEIKKLWTKPTGKEDIKNLVFATID